MRTRTLDRHWISTERAAETERPGPWTSTGFWIREPEIDRDRQRATARVDRRSPLSTLCPRGNTTVDMSDPTCKIQRRQVLIPFFDVCALTDRKLRDH